MAQPKNSFGDALTLADKPTIAVLPFDNMSGDSDQEFFADGLVEDIITALSHLPEFRVIARNSTFTYKGKPIDIVTAARELRAHYVLEGSVRGAGIDVKQQKTGVQLWLPCHPTLKGELDTWRLTATAVTILTTPGSACGQVVANAWCDASAHPMNGNKGDCPSDLASGATCQPTCDAGHTVSGTTSCTAGALAAAVAMPDPVFGERVCVYVELRPGETNLPLDELLDDLMARGVSKETWPEKLVIVDRLPRGSGGKVAKEALRQDIRQRLADRT